MRTIKFRGRHLCGQWYYGNLIVRETDSPVPETTQVYRSVMIGDVEDGSEEEIEEETVGQYTGMNDAYGNEIYEGDILHIPEDDFNGEIKGVVMFENDSFVVKSIRSNWSALLSWCNRKDHETKHYVRPTKVVGNIHDNPEYYVDYEE